MADLQSQMLELHSFNLSDLFKISVTIHSQKLEALLGKIIETQTQQAKFLDNLQKTFATKEDVKNEVKDIQAKFSTIVRDAVHEVHQRIDPIDERLQNTENVITEIQKRQEDDYNMVMERIVEIEQSTDEKINNLIKRTEDLKTKTNKIQTELSYEAERIDNVYDLFEMPHKQVYELLKIKGATSEKKKDLLFDLPVFKNITSSIQNLDEDKASKKETAEITDDLRNTQKKMKQMKEKVKQQIKKKVASSTKKEMEKQLDPIKLDLEQKISQKADNVEVMDKLSLKAEKSVCDQKADLNNTLRLFENVKRQLEDSLRELGDWGKDMQSDLDLKAYRHELDIVDHKITSQITNEEQNNSASARYRCLCCGSLEPIDQSQNSKEKESFLFPNGRPKSRSPGKTFGGSIDRLPPKESVGKDGRVYLTERISSASKSLQSSQEIHPQKLISPSTPKSASVRMPQITSHSQLDTED